MAGGSPRLAVFESEPAMAEAAADWLADAIDGRDAPVLALPTGRTPIPLYGELARRRARGAAPDLSRARAFNLDELVLPSAHPASFAAYMRRHAGERIGLQAERCVLPRTGPDLAAACRDYDRLLEVSPIDAAIVGVGADGHVAYNLPGPVHQDTHVVELPERLAESLGVAGDHRPLRAVTLGFAPLLSARRLLLLAAGAEKAAALRALLEGADPERWPCAVLRSHPRFDVFLTRELAAAMAGAPEGRAGGEP